MKDKKIVFFGTGAIGGSVGAWILPYCSNIWFADRGPVLESLKQSGITVYEGGRKEETVLKQAVNVIESPDDLKDADIIVLGVKNYSLKPVAEHIRSITGDRPLIVSMANGAENQDVLPEFFSKVVYCVVSYNAWMDEPVTIGYQKKGPLILGTPDNSLMKEMKEIAGLFNRGVETVVTEHLDDAVHSKIVVNLTNSLTTLIGHGFRELTDMNLFQNLLTNTLYEGIQVLKANGYKECRLGGMPSWGKMTAGAKLPQFLTRNMFRNNVKKMVMSSMSQDILQRGGSESELESLNGYILKLADRKGMKIPYNRAVYQLCREGFGREHFSPLDVTDVWARVEEIRQ